MHGEWVSQVCSEVKPLISVSLSRIIRGTLCPDLRKYQPLHFFGGVSLPLTAVTNSAFESNESQPATTEHIDVSSTSGHFGIREFSKSRIQLVKIEALREMSCDYSFQRT